jgi:hypothetical protein
MASRRPHLRVVHDSEASSSACGSDNCDLNAAAAGFCASCLAVFTTAEVLYRRLVARDMARLELRTPGFGTAGMGALQARLATLDPPTAPEAPHWTPEEWEIDRLESFMVELRAAMVRESGA